MAARGSSNRRRRRDGGVTPEALSRRGTAEFGPSFSALKEAVSRACAGESEWEARIVAGIGAVVEFTLGDLAAARALTVCAGASAMPASNPERELLAYFGERLEEVVPGKMLFPISSAESIVEMAAILIRGYLRAGTAERLPELGPELVYLTLMPYLGLDEARKWAATFSPAKIVKVGNRTE